MRHLILFENYINENNFYTFGDILKRKHINDNKENVIDDFKVGYKVLPSKWYKNMDEIRDKYAHVIKLDNNFVYVKNIFPKRFTFDFRSTCKLKNYFMKINQKLFFKLYI